MSEGRPRALIRGAAVLGVALSGFFDGILLHQILGWHHLLSLVDAERLRDPAAQIIADGVFHAVMYALAAWGLTLLWRQRATLAAPQGGRRLAGGLLLGFGAWNIFDVAVVHWMLGLHRLRLDVAHPAVWDTAWLLGLGAAPAVVGLLLLRRGSEGGAGGRPANFAYPVLAIVTVLAGAWSAQPPAGGSDTLVVLRPGADAMALVVAADARLIQIDSTGRLILVRLPDGASGWELYKHGALIVQGAGPAGCLTWTA